MNQWSSRTLNLVTSQDYLDKLQEIYPHEDQSNTKESNMEHRQFFLRYFLKNF